MLTDGKTPSSPWTASRTWAATSPSAPSKASSSAPTPSSVCEHVEGDGRVDNLGEMVAFAEVKEILGIEEFLSLRKSVER
jgi:hypothetical protein